MCTILRDETHELPTQQDLDRIWIVRILGVRHEVHCVIRGVPVIGEDFAVLLRRAKRVAKEGVIMMLEMAKKWAAATLYLEVSALYVNFQHTCPFKIVASTLAASHLYRFDTVRISVRSSRDLHD